MRERRVGSGEEVRNCAESPKSSQMIKCLRTAETWPGLERSQLFIGLCVEALVRSWQLNLLQVAVKARGSNLRSLLTDFFWNGWQARPKFSHVYIGYQRNTEFHMILASDCQCRMVRTWSGPSGRLRMPRLEGRDVCSKGKQ